MKLWRAILAAVFALLCLGAAPTTAPDVVVLKELQSRYEPVPFDHKTHAAMAQMWDGCTTCHHRQPEPSSQPIALTSAKRQADSAAVPACKSCHETSSQKADLHRPNLKGAYHRQCLNCHREWADENACEICHKPLGSVKVAQATTAPSVDDIVGRMHPPIAEPEVKVYKTRFTPAVGSNAIFRHKEHTTAYGLKCASCHHRDNCADCHNGITRTIAHKPINPGRTWNDSHAPCVTCHQQDRCAHCHFDAKDKPPPPGGVRIRANALLWAGMELESWVTTQPAGTRVPVIASPATQPTTRAVIKRIRR